MDVLSHAIEAYVSNAASPITDMHALEAMRLVAASLRRTVEAPHQLEERGQMMLASLQAGLAFSNASLGAVHAMAHSLGGLLDSPHGECNAILLPHVIEFNFDAVPERYRKIARMMGVRVDGMASEEVKGALMSALVRLRQGAGITQTLGQMGVTRDIISELARVAMNDPCIFTNPRQPSQQDLEEIYERAL
jgi:alcohol dehydrogenase class IV